MLRSVLLMWWGRRGTGGGMVAREGRERARGCGLVWRPGVDVVLLPITRWWWRCGLTRAVPRRDGGVRRARTSPRDRGVKWGAWLVGFVLGRRTRSGGATVRTQTRARRWTKERTNFIGQR